MGGPAGAGANDHRAVLHAHVLQPRDEVLGEERRVRGGGHGEGAVGMVGGHPVEPGEHAGQGAELAGEVVGHHGQAVRRQTLRVAVGADDQRRALEPQGGDEPVGDRLAPDRPQALVAAAHAGGEAAGQEDADHRRSSPAGAGTTLIPPPGGFRRA